MSVGFRCGACWRLWDPIRHKVLGLDKQVVVDYDDIKQQLLDLVVIMLGESEVSANTVSTNKLNLSKESFKNLAIQYSLPINLY